MNTKTTIDQTTLTITFQREIEASRDEVFDAWTKPDQIKHWWDPTGTPLAECDIDLKPGGAFRFVNASGHAPPFSGVYRVLERPAQIVFDAMGAVGTVKLEAVGASTHMTVTIRSPSREHMDQFVRLGVDVGTAKTLDNLGTYVVRHRKAG